MDQHTIRIVQQLDPICHQPEDPVLAEFRELTDTDRTISLLRRYCVDHGIPTRLDTAMNYKGRTYYTLDAHPVVRRKKTRMRQLRAIFAQRRADSIQSGKIIEFNPSALPAPLREISHPALPSCSSVPSVVKISGGRA